MTLTRREYKALRGGCFSKKPFVLELHALVHAAMMQAKPPRANTRRDITKALRVYHCEFCDHFHVGHRGQAVDHRLAFRIKGKPRKIVLARPENF